MHWALSLALLLLSPAVILSFWISIPLQSGLISVISFTGFYFLTNLAAISFEYIPPEYSISPLFRAAALVLLIGASLITLLSLFVDANFPVTERNLAFS